MGFLWKKVAKHIEAYVQKYMYENFWRISSLNHNQLNEISLAQVTLIKNIDYI